MDTPLHPNRVANFFIEYSKEFNHNGIHPMSLNKLVYIANGWYWALFNKPLINEPIIAWKHGPIVPTVYYSFRYNGQHDDIEDGYIRESLDGYDVVVNSQTIAFLEKLYDAYREFTHTQLSTICHSKGTPWYNLSLEQNKKGFPKNFIIDDALIREYYCQLALKSGEQKPTE